MKLSNLLGAIFLGIIAGGHLLRLLLEIQITVGQTVMPWWTSLFGLLISATLSFLLWRDRLR